MTHDAQLYLDKLTELFGKKDAIHKIEPLVDGGKPIFVFFYENLPEPGCMSAITYGLSESNHQDWLLSRPEIIITLESFDKSWGLAAAFFASSFQGIKPFSYGDLFTLDEPISSESDMMGFFVFAPAFLNQEQSTIQLSTKKISLKGMYPLYKEEVDLFHQIGLETFWKSNDDFDIYNTKRKNLALANQQSIFQKR
jgi:hypothetical protein